MRRKVKVVAVAAFIVFFAAVPALAQVIPVQVGDPNQDVVGYAFDMDPADRAVAVLQEQDGAIDVVTRTGSGPVSAPQQVNTGRGKLPAVAVNGGAAITWISDDGGDDLVHLRLLNRDGTLTPDTVLSASGTDAVAVTVGVAGDVVVAWQSSTVTGSRIYLRLLKGSGALGSIHAVSPAGGTNTDLHLALNPNRVGAFDWLAFVTWVAGDTLFGRALDRDGAMSPVVTVSGGNTGGVLSQSVSIDTVGRVLVAWIQANDGRVHARFRTNQGELSDIRALTAAGADVDAVVTSANWPGNAWVAWRRNVKGIGRLQTRQFFDDAWWPSSVATPPSMNVQDIAVDDCNNGDHAAFFFTSLEQGPAERFRTIRWSVDRGWSPSTNIVSQKGIVSGSPILVTSCNDGAAIWLAPPNAQGHSLAWSATYF